MRLDPKHRLNTSLPPFNSKHLLGRVGNYVGTWVIPSFSSACVSAAKIVALSFQLDCDGNFRARSSLCITKGRELDITMFGAAISVYPLCILERFLHD